jgi:hypothetical protein
LSAIILSALAGAAKAADITTAPIPTGGIVIHIDGDITPGDEKTFSALKISDPDKTLVWVSGTGGSLVVAFRIGKQIKELGLTTVVNTGWGLRLILRDDLDGRTARNYRAKFGVGFSCTLRCRITGQA